MRPPGGNDLFASDEVRKKNEPTIKVHSLIVSSLVFLIRRDCNHVSFVYRLLEKYEVYNYMNQFSITECL